MNPFGTGVIRSEPDYRDTLASGIVADTSARLPGSFETDISNLAVMMQHHIPSCVSHAWALVMKYYWFRKTGKLIDFSPRFLDILSSEPDIPFDGGRRPRTVCKVAASMGCCTTALLPNDTITKPGEADDDAIRRYRGATITDEMKAEAEQYKIPGYVYISDDSPLDFRSGVYKFGLVSGLFKIGNELWTPSYNPADIMPLRTPKQIVSGHEMVIYGWEGVLNKLRNHWSEKWGYGGNGTYDPQQWLPYILEGWSIAVIPDDVKQWLSSLPKQSEFHYHWGTDLKKGDFSEGVKFAQIALSILGYMEPFNPDDLGHYGPKTSRAVAKYQAARGIYPAYPDNIGPKTRAFLNRDFAI